MNLGDASLRFVNTSRPQLIHTASKQSVTVSDDYYSLGSDESNTDDRTTVLRYQTPPSQMRSPDASRDALQSEATVPTIRPVAHEPPASNTKQSAVSFGDGEVMKSRPGTANSSTVQKFTNSEVSPPTPGVDDTPYIRFAIDQLTRDEELLGRRRQEVTSEESYPIGTIDRVEDTSRKSTGHERQPSDLEIKRPDTPAIHNVLMPVDPDEDSLQYPRLNFVPRPLRILSIAVLIFCCFLMMAALILCNVWSSQHHGLLAYDGVRTSRYFLFQYLPQLCAILIIIWLFIIQSATQRILPFSSLASGRNIQNLKILHGLALLPTNFLIPNLAFFKSGEPLLGLCYLIFWLSLFTVPLQSSFFQTRYYSLQGQDIWRWTAVQPVGWTLLVLYVLLVVALVLLLLRFSRRDTGLRWDSESLADILVLLHRSNILSDFAGSEVQRALQNEHVSKSYRLGYWTTSGQPDKAFHTIGETNAPDQGYHPKGGKTRTTYGSVDPDKFDLEGQRSMPALRVDTLQADIHSPAVRYRWTPWFLRDTFVVAWIIIAVVLMIAFVVVSFVNHAVENGFLPLLPAPTTSQGFSPANFLYSFLPCLLGMILFLAWQPIDLYFRALQPFASLSNLRGATAEQSLLLEYTACLPVEVTVKAALAGHYKVAWISFVSLLCFTLPVLGGGIFTAQFFEATQDVRMAASMPGYEALVVFVIVYALSFLVIWPTRKRHLPHDISTLGQLISFIYESPLLRDGAFSEPRTKVDLVTRLLAPARGEKSSPKYAFGVYRGNDGREHLGIDRLQRPGSGEMLITTGTMK